MHSTIQYLFKKCGRRGGSVLSEAARLAAFAAIAAIAGIVIVQLYGCAGNSDSTTVQGGGVDNSGLCGTWIMTRMTYEVGTATYTVLASDSQQMTLTLNSDLTYHQQQVSNSSGVKVTTDDKGIWSVSGSGLNQTSDAGVQTSGSYSLADDVMVLTCTKVSQGQTITTVYQFRRG